MILIALLGVGLFALPQTVALFAGQHSFVNIDATGNQIDCRKCHGDVQAELAGTADTPHDEFTCSMCHRIEAGKASGDAVLYTVNYKNDSATPLAMRTMVLSETDYEAGRIPATVDNQAKTNLILPGNGDPSFLSMAMSDSSDPLVTATLIESGEPKRVDLLNADGTPKDTNISTRYSGVRLASYRNGKLTVYATFTYAAGKQPTLNIDGLGSEVVNPGGAYHAASLVSCLECHGGEAPLGHEAGDLSTCSNCHYGGSKVVAGQLGQQMRNLQAGGFGLTGMVGDTGAREAHMEFQLTDDGLTQQINSFDQSGSNGACVACHTHVAVDITYTKPSVYKFDATLGAVDTVETFVVGGTTYTYSDGR